MNLDDVNLRDVSRSLDDVGKTKAAGYLPLNTIRKLLKRDAEEYLDVLRQRGLTAYLLSDQETCIEGGVLVAFGPKDVHTIMTKHESVLRTAAVPPNADALMRHLMMHWYEDDHALMPFIRDLYNDPA